MTESEILKEAFLKSDSPRQAFYHLWIEKVELNGQIGYLVRKESGVTIGAMEKIQHRESWFRESLASADTFFDRRIKQKTSRKRNTKRVYVIDSGDPRNPIPSNPMQTASGF